jgi:predicted O-methyltransferase YrrM
LRAPFDDNETMSYRLLCEALLSGRPYFGPALRAIQGPPERHQYFRPVVKAAAAGTASPRLQILEVGSWAGASAISFSTALSDLGLDGEITCVDAWKPYFDTDKDQAHVYRQMNSAADNDKAYKLFQHNIAAAGITGRVRIRRGLSQYILPELVSHAFDVVYIDGSHRYSEALFDIQHGIRLVKTGGILCGDDLELQSDQIESAELAHAAQDRRDVVFSPSANGYYHPGVTAAVAEALGQVCTWAGFWAMRRTSDSFEPVALDLEAAEVPLHVRQTLYQKVGCSGDYDLYLRDDTYFAVSSWVPEDLVDELLWGTELPPLIFRGNTLADVEQKINSKAQSPTGPADHAPIIIGEHRGFNIVKFAGTIYGLRQAAGKIDLFLGDQALLERYGDDTVVIGASVADIQSRIELKELAQTVSSLRNGLHTVEQELSHLHTVNDHSREIIETSATSQHELKDKITTAERRWATDHENLRADLQTVSQQHEHTLANLAASVATLDLTVHSLHDAALAEVRELSESAARVHSVLDEMRYGTGDRKSPRFLENYRGFQLVRQEDRVYAIPDGAAPGSAIFDTSSPDLAKARIDAYLAEQLVKELLKGEQEWRRQSPFARRRL